MYRRVQVEVILKSVDHEYYRAAAALRLLYLCHMRCLLIMPTQKTGVSIT